MDPDRPYRCNSINSNSTAVATSAATTTGELFICFTSRLSSSSTPTMKISSSTKSSIVSPGRAARGGGGGGGGGDPHQISLSNSLSRRLRSNGSMRSGQASPMFSKKRGNNGFEIAEPSSPKVTCIGQVRVKTKKQGKRKTIVRARSVRAGEVSFRRVEQSTNTTITANNSGNNNSNGNNSNGNGFEEFGGDGGNNNINKDYNFQLQNQQQRSNQRWVHLPLSICEALREFSCFLPCRSSCMTSEKEKAEKLVAAGRSSQGGGGCPAVFARWLVEEVDGGGEGGKELVAVSGRAEQEEEHNEEEEEDEDEEGRRRSYRRHVFEGIEFKELEKSISGEQEGEEASRVSICIPPKNALLLMRCRSDPVRMAALANKFLEPATRDKDGDFKQRTVKEEEEEEEDKGTPSSFLETEEESEVSKVVVELETENVIEDLNVCEKSGSCGSDDMVVEQQIIEEESEAIVLETGEGEKSEVNLQDEEKLVEEEEEEEEEEEVTQVVEVKNSNQETAILVDSSSVLAPPEEEEEDNEDDIPSLRHFFEEQEIHNTRLSEREQQPEEEEEIEEDLESIQCGQEDGEVGNEDMLQARGALMESSSSTLLEELDKAERAEQEEQKEEERAMTHDERSGPEDPRTTTQEGQLGLKSREKECQQPLLPDCLLLMMCEPKLSMEVSKETWVCSTDFIRWLPDRRSRSKVNKKEGGDETKKRISFDLNAAPLQQSKNNCSLQPPRSSCSYPAQPPHAKRAGGGSCGGGGAAGAMIVLTRCKSEPHGQAAKLAPESCFWKNRKLEPHRPSRVGVGAARVS